MNKIAAIAAIATIVLLLSASVFFCLEQVKKQLEAHIWVIHSLKVISDLHYVRATVKDAEIAQQAYVLTGRPEYIQSFKEAEPKIEQRIGTVRNLTRDNPVQQRQVGVLSVKVEEKLSVLKETIDLVRSNKREAAIAIIESDRNKKLLEDVRNIIQKMMSTEDQLLASRTAVLDAQTQETTVSMIVPMAVSIFLVLVLALLVWRFLEARKRAERSFHQMAENIKEIFWITNAQGNTPLYVSPAYEQIFGRTVESLFARPQEFFEATHEDDRARLAETIRHQRKAQGSCEIEYRIRRPNGEIRWLWARLSSIVDETGAVSQLCGATNDISERKEAETRVDEFYSTVSHELRTPLTSIRASLGLIEGGKAGELPAKAMQFIKIGRVEADRLIRLINDILDIKKIEAGRLELNKVAIDPRKLVSRTLDAIGPMAKEAGVTLDSRIKTRDQIYGDFERIMQVLTNLVSNAIKFSPEDSKVTVTVESKQDSVRFGIKDEGSGIPADQIKQLFGKFKQLDSSDSRNKGGTGLGLAISKSIVEQHSGEIGVDSEVGKGSVFWFELPIDRKTQTDDSSGGIKVLVVESDEYWSGVLNQIFSDGTFDTVFIDSVTAVEEQLQSFRPDIIVMDLQSTDGAGIELLEKLNSNNATNGIPVVILSADDRDKVLKGQTLQIDWVKKPFEPVQIKKAVTKVLRQRQPGPVTILIVEDDPATRDVLRHQIADLGVNCLEASDGLQAIDIARNENFDLMILDLGLPLLDGFEVVKVLRKDKSKHIPLIVYTDRDLTREERKALSLGLTSHFVKSRTTEEELITCVKDLLNGLLEHKDYNDKN